MRWLRVKLTTAPFKRGRKILCVALITRGLAAAIGPPAGGGAGVEFACMAATEAGNNKELAVPGAIPRDKCSLVS